MTKQTPAVATPPSSQGLAGEEAAQRIFEHYLFGAWETGEKPAWVPGGNSTMQGVARAKVSLALKALQRRKKQP